MEVRVATLDDFLGRCHSSYEKELLSEGNNSPVHITYKEGRHSGMSIVFSGIQPSGSIHIGNYFGAIRNWVKLQELHQCYYCIVDYHAITVAYEPEQMRQKTLEAALDLMACGIDLEKIKLFVQSQVPEHTELAWLLSCTAPMGELNRMTQFKEKSERLESVNVGLFSYPVLQTADILLYKADTVPVGEDQLQHLELCREITRRFNARFGETFPEPQPMLTKAARIMDYNDPTRKMSKSVDNSAVMLNEPAEAITKRIKRAVTDLGPAGEGMSPGVANLFLTLEACDATDAQASLMEDYNAGKLRYSDLKNAVTEGLLSVLTPIRERKAELAEHPDRVIEALAASSAECRKVARATVAEVRDRMGLRLPPG